ncbi:Transcription Factor IIF, Rap30/Rap74, interaction,Winged helix-turn-helix DNA-binding [Cinara cedri]|uniref:Transcription initiation factor IIF subunit alpha n=1 Tax=Cinara cedri TaxID=506608 RepID=A0A5E4M4J3_9HEMI|nr:Transcription Factor IIF, Rap30/Rap74, interaction,Winged helix-turn-helix DNA-binding [Cinara cedri]
MSYPQKMEGFSKSYTPLSQFSTIKEFSLKVLKAADVKHQIMKFNSNLNIDFSKWSHARMERDFNKLVSSFTEEEMPKFGAGSEFGREARQEAKKRRYGGNKKVSESSPWLLKVGGKKFRGVREGGITDNSSYYLFTHGEDNVINAFKLEEWYNFQPVQRYKTLTVEEAEEEFGRRNKVMNHFTVMLQKRLKTDDDEVFEEDEKIKGTKNKKSKELKISELEEWVESDGDNSDEDDETDQEKIDKKKKQKEKSKKKAMPKKKSKRSDESASEDSDDGDAEGKELDYISDSSENVSDDEAKVTKEMQGVSEEKALKSLLTSDEDEDEEEEKKLEDKKEDNKSSDLEEDDKSKKDEKVKQTVPIKKKKKTLEKKVKKDSESESESSVDSSDIDCEPIRKKSIGLDLLKSNSNDSVGFSIDPSNQSLEPAHKKARMEFLPVSISDTHGINEESVRRYLSRKPITTTQLVTKFKNRSNLSSEQLVSIIALLLKKINPEKKMIKNKMYLSLKHG